MRSRIAVVLLFMFSFVIAHDTVISVIADKQPERGSVYQVKISHDMILTEHHSADLGQLHSMFHFVALTPLCVHLLDPFHKNKTLLTYQLRHTLYYTKTSYKPPIA